MSDEQIERLIRDVEANPDATAALNSALSGFAGMLEENASNVRKALEDNKSDEDIAAAIEEFGTRHEIIKAALPRLAAAVTANTPAGAQSPNPNAPAPAHDAPVTRAAKPPVPGTAPQSLG